MRNGKISQIIITLLHQCLVLTIIVAMKIIWARKSNLKRLRITISQQLDICLIELGCIPDWYIFPVCYKWTTKFSKWWRHIFLEFCWLSVNPFYISWKIMTSILWASKLQLSESKDVELSEFLCSNLQIIEAKCL